MNQGMATDVFRDLKRIKAKIPAQTYRSIAGQIRAGDILGARIGLERVRTRLAGEGRDHDHSSGK